MTETHYHTTVLLNEAVDALNIVPNGTYVDCTFGGGGHSKAILSKLGENGRLFAFDQDKDAWNNKLEDNRFTLIGENFSLLKRYMLAYKVDGVDGILADIGVSSWQLDEGDRGFSIRYDGPLDMRMDQRQKMSAKTVVNTYSATDLQTVLSLYGELRNAKTLANAIVAKREEGFVFDRTEQLLAVVDQCAMGPIHKYRAQVFQAIRIEVNNELNVLKSLIDQAYEVLNPAGRLAIITFHSLEDRIVKLAFRAPGDTINDITGQRAPRKWKEVYKKPIEASEAELKVNKRSRSAKLRVAEKCSG
jgi:16S rRNA (cytosine1402-N4)-methyltransferase